MLSNLLEDQTSNEVSFRSKASVNYFGKQKTRSLDTLEEHQFFKRINDKLRHHDGGLQKDGHWLVDSMWFSTCVGALVVINAIILGFETDYPQYHNVWLIFENTFTALFLLEMILKLIFLQINYFFDVANWLDAVIVGFSVVDCWLSALFGDGGGKLKNFQVLRMLRMVRIVRVIRILRYCRRLVLVVRGVIKAMETTFWVACVLLVSVYCCAIFVTEFVGRGTEQTYPGYSEDANVIDEQELMQNFNPFIAFGGMAKSMFTLFNIAIMSEWVEVVRPIGIKQPWMMFFFISFALFVTFGIMNVIVAMIVDNVLQEKTILEEEERIIEKKQKKSEWENLIMLIRDLEDDDHTIPFERLKVLMEEEELFCFGYDEYNGDDRSFLNKLEEFRAKREMDVDDFYEELDIRDSYGEQVSLENGSLFKSFKKGLSGPMTTTQKRLPKLLTSQFPLSVKLCDEQNRAFHQLLERCNFPEALSAEELMMMFDSTGDNVLQHHEFLTNFYRLIEGNELQQISLLQGSINRVKFLLQSKIETVRNDLQEIRKATSTQHSSRSIDTAALTSLIQETHRITEKRLQSLEEMISQLLKSPHPYVPTKATVGQFSGKIDTIKPEQSEFDDASNSGVEVECQATREVGSTGEGDCRALSCKAMDTNCGVACAENECNGNASGPRKTELSAMRSKDFPAVSDYWHIESPKLHSCPEHVTLAPDCNNYCAKGLTCEITAGLEESATTGNSLSENTSPSCNREKHAHFATTPMEGSGGSVCFSTLPMKNDNPHFTAIHRAMDLHFKVVVEHGCSLGCSVSWKGLCPKISEVHAEALHDLRQGDLIVECEAASTYGKSREELLRVFQTTRPLHLRLCRLQDCLTNHNSSETQSMLPKEAVTSAVFNE